MKLASAAGIGFVFVLAACGDRSSNKGVGFTGIGNEPSYASAPQKFEASKTGAAAAARPDTGTDTVEYSYGSAGASNAASRHALARRAETAIRRGGSLRRNSRAVELNGRNLRLSRVTVNDTEFAVLKFPASTLYAKNLNNDDLVAFGQNVAVWTGCSKGQGLYGYGPHKGSFSGLAIPVNC